MICPYIFNSLPNTHLVFMKMFCHDWDLPCHHHSFACVFTNVCIYIHIFVGICFVTFSLFIDWEDLWGKLEWIYWPDWELCVCVYHTFGYSCELLHANILHFIENKFIHTYRGIYSIHTFVQHTPIISICK